MKTVERVAKGLFAANLITAAEREGVRSPCDERITWAWRNNPRARERWTKIANMILDKLHGVDLGAMTGGGNDGEAPVLLAGIDRRRAAERWIDRATLCLLVVGSFVAGALFAFVILKWLNQIQ